MSDVTIPEARGLLPEAVMPLYASMDSTAAPPRSLVQFAHRLIEDAAISGGDLGPTTVEQGALANSIAYAILAEAERCAKIAEDRKTPVMKYGSKDAKHYHLAGISYASHAIAQAIRSSHE